LAIYTLSLHDALPISVFKNSIRKSDSSHSRRRSKRLWPNARKQDNRSDFRGHPKWTDCADRLPSSFFSVNPASVAFDNQTVNTTDRKSTRLNSSHDQI